MVLLYSYAPVIDYIYGIKFIVSCAISVVAHNPEIFHITAIYSIHICRRTVFLRRSSIIIKIRAEFLD